MAALTKAQLVTELSTLRVYCQQLEAKLASAQTPRAPRPTYTPPAPSAEQLARRAAMAAAKAQAMSTGKSVLVG